MNAAEKLVNLRGEKTQRDVATAVGITTSAYANYEQGIRVPRDKIKIKLAEFFNVTVEEIFFK